MQDPNKSFIQDTQRVSRSSQVIEKKIMDDLVLLHRSTGNHYALNSTGTVIWNYCAEKRRYAEILDHLTQEFQKTADQGLKEDVLTHLKDMLDEGLLQLEAEAD